MSIHEGFLELAAASIDFDLDEYDQAELDRHLAGCDECRRTAAAYRDDANAIAYEAGPGLSRLRSDAILAAALRSPTSGPPLRIFVAVALVAVIGAGLLAVGLGLFRRADSSLIAGVPGPSASNTTGQPSSGATTQPSGPAGSTSEPGVGTPRPPGSPDINLLPVRASGQELGTGILMAPGPDDDLFVSIPAAGGTVLTRLDSSGRAARGWPIRLPGASPCGLLLPVDDGTIRLVCHADDLAEELGEPPVRAFAFDAVGRLLPGWPVELPCCFTGRVVGDDLVVASPQAAVDLVEEGQPVGSVRVAVVAADGTVRNGVEVPFMQDCCGDGWAIGPDGVAYGTVHHSTATSVSSELAAVGLDGIRDGFPVVIDGDVSGPAFDAAGRIHVTDVSGAGGPAQTFVLDGDGRPVPTGSTQLGITATSDWWGAGDSHPAAPLVGTDGTTFVIDTTRNTTVAGLDPSGQLMTGWPYRSSLALQDTGFCGPGDTGCGGFRAAPAIGPDNVLFLLHVAETSSAGGSIAVIGPDGQAVDGWPLGLRRAGSEFWSIVVASDSQAYALAIEPEPNGSHSATILSISPDSTVRYRATIVEP